MKTAVTVPQSHPTVRLIASAVMIAALYLTGLMAIHRLTSVGRFERAAPVTAGSAEAMDYRQIPVETSRGTLTSLAATNGHVRIVTMFYSHCPGACPLTVETLQELDRALSAAQRAKLNFVLLSLDPGKDSPGALRTYESQRRIDSNRWIVGRSATADVARLAAALGVKYRTLSDGAVDHSNVIVLLDARGQVLARSTATQVIDGRFLAAVRDAVDAS
jgi:protein SCO1/2